MSAAKLQKRVERLEDVCAGAWLLLLKLQQRYGSDFGEGMSQQVRQCLRDCNQIAKERKQRDDAKAARGTE